MYPIPLSFRMILPSLKNVDDLFDQKSFPCALSGHWNEERRPTMVLSSIFEIQVVFLTVYQVRSLFSLLICSYSLPDPR